MKIVEKKKIMAVIGDPIAHSLSPFLHAQVIKSGKYNANYIAKKVTRDELVNFCNSIRNGKFLENLHEEGNYVMAGFNATMPHKEALLGLVDRVSHIATSFGAINTVKCDEGGRLVGYNTDVGGLLMAFSSRNVEIKDAHVLLIGAGGVAGALVRGFLKAGASEVTVLNRTEEKGVKLCDGLKGATAFSLTSENLRRASHAADLIVNCTPMGMSGSGSDFEDFDFLKVTKATICDLIYNPWETKLLKVASELGLKGINGMDMFIYQGLLAFEIFMDCKLDLKAEHDRLLPLCKEEIFKW